MLDHARDGEPVLMAVGTLESESESWLEDVLLRLKYHLNQQLLSTFKQACLYNLPHKSLCERKEGCFVKLAFNYWKDEIKVKNKTQNHPELLTPFKWFLHQR